MSTSHAKATGKPLAKRDAGCVHPSLAGVTMVSEPSLVGDLHIANRTQPDTTASPPGDTNVDGAYLAYNE